MSYGQQYGGQQQYGQQQYGGQTGGVSDQQLQVYIDQVFAQFDRDGSQSLDVH